MFIFVAIFIWMGNLLALICRERNHIFNFTTYTQKLIGNKDSRERFSQIKNKSVDDDVWILKKYFSSSSCSVKPWKQFQIKTRDKKKVFISQYSVLERD